MARGGLIGALRVTLGLETVGYERGLAKARQQSRRAGKQIESSMVSATRAVAGLAAGFSAVAAARSFIQIADKAKSLDAQLRLATASFGSFGKAQTDVQRIAETTRSGLEETTKLYGNFVRATEQMGGTQDEASRATETFSKALKIGGAGAQEAASATLQFGQALASGVLRGDEFNSIAEASPRILRLLADALGVPQGKLRELAAEGQLTSDVLFRALTDPKFTSGIDEEFDRLPKTVSEAMQQVENAAIVTFGAFDRGGEFSNMIANFVTGGADDFKGLAQAAEELGIDIRATLSTLHDVFNPLLDGGRSVFDALGLDSRSVTQQIKDDFRSVLTVIDGINLAGANLLGTARTNYAGEFDARVKTGRERAQDDRRTAAWGGDSFKRYLADPTRVDLLGNRIGGGVRAGMASAAAAGKKTRGKSADQLARDAERDRQKLLRDQLMLDRELIDQQREWLDAQIDLTDDYVERSNLATKMVDLDLQAAKRQNEYDAASDGITGLVRQQRDAHADQLAVLRRKEIWQKTELERLAEIADLERVDYDLQEQALRGQAALAETAAERREVERRLLDLALAEERKTIERLKAGNWRDREEAARREEALPRNYARETLMLNAATRGPWEQFLTSLPDTAAKADEALQAVSANGMADLVDGLSDAMAGARSLGDVFSQVSKRIVADLIRIQLQKAIVGGLQGALGGVFGGGVPSTAAVGRMNAGAYAGFASALPKLASGGSISVTGNAGLDTNLLSINGRPVAMVNRGERIRVDPNSPGRGGGGGGDSQVEITLNDPLLQGKIVSGAAVVTHTGIRRNNDAQAFRSTRRVA